MMAQHKAQPIPYDDSLIAAIARSCDMIVVTRNEKHFPGCKTVNPWTTSKKGKT
jgi:predicted nucleic acid-binding protein